MNRITTLTVLACAIPVLASAQEIRRMQHPAVSPDGKTVLFSWQGDLWRVPVAGGRAERLTIHPSMDTRPRWFPDGSRIAFASTRFGNFDVFTMRPDGSDLRRLTFESSSDVPNAVSPDGTTIYGYTNAWGRQDLFRVGVGGGDLVRLTDHPLEAEFLPVPSPDGSKIFYNRGAYGTTSWQKSGLVSSALPEVWVADNTVPLSNHRKLTQNERTDLSPTPATDGWVYTISNASGSPNVWRMRADGTGSKQLTFHTNGTSRNPTTSRDGRTVAYEFDSDLWVLDTATGATRKLAIDVPGDARNNPTAELTATSGLDGFAVSPDGKRTVIVERGDLFLIPERGGTTRRLTTNPSWDMQPVWLDARTILYVSMEDGRRKLKTVTVDGTIKDFLSDPRDLTHPQVSPDGKQVAFHRGENEIVVVPAGGGTAKVVFRGGFVDALDGGPLFSWSPDSAWLVANVIEGRRINVTLAELATDRKVVAARLVFRPQMGTASTPQFLPNGRGVYFTSPEFTQQDLFIVDLVPAELTFTEDDLDKIDEPRREERKDVKVSVYEPGIEYRLRRLTTTGASGGLASPDSRTIWANVQAPAGGFQLVGIPVAGGVPTPVPGVTGTASGAELSKDGKKVYFINGGRLLSLTLGAPAPTPVNYEARWTVDLKAEERALFEDIVWAMERLYYDPKLHGKDWPRIKERYSKAVPYAYDRQDFYAMMSEMMEELDSSHLGSTAPSEATPGEGSDSTALLGVEFDPRALAARSSYIVSRIIPLSPADDPSSKLLVGDKIVTVDGVTPSATNPIAGLLNRKAGRRVVLGIERDGKAMTVAIKPTSSAARTGLEYEAFVAQQRRLVDKYSNGKLGYVHIRGMDQVSLDRFLRETRTQAEGKQGVVIDCRYNGGGSTAVQILGILIRQPWLVRATRGEFGSRLSENLWRSDALELPTALMVNTYSFSNAEIIAEGFRRLKRGPIVGERTPGYVIGTGGYALWDGGFIRMPSIGAYTVEGENLENNGRRPDYTVWFDPNAWSKGEDPQLEKAVRELERTLR